MEELMVKAGLVIDEIRITLNKEYPSVIARGKVFPLCQISYDGRGGLDLSVMLNGTNPHVTEIINIARKMFVDYLEEQSMEK